MRNLLRVSILTLAVAGFSACDKKPGSKDVELKTDQQKASYAIGQQIGQNLGRQNLELDADVLGASIRDALEGKESRLKPEEMQAALQNLQQAQIEKRKKESEENEAKGKAFLVENKAKEGVKTLESGLQYRVLEEGSGPSPTEDDTVVAHYKGTLIDGTPFDSSYERGEPAEFPVRGVIPGWTEALQKMKKGAKWELFIPAELAYGAAGRPGIPPNSVLLFEVELIDIKKDDEKPAAGKPEAGKPAAGKPEAGKPAAEK